MALTWPYKDPNEVLDYVLDWTARLNGDTITASTWEVSAGTIVVDNDTLFDNTTATLWLSGGAVSESYDIVNRVVTSGGRTMDQTVKLKIKAR